MADSSETRALVLFDGECSFCNDAVLFIIDRDPHEHFVFAPLASELGQRRLDELGLRDPSFDSMVLIENGRGYTHSDAPLQISRRLSGAWPLCVAFFALPRALRNALYRGFAKRRYALVRSRNAVSCAHPRAEAQVLGLSIMPPIGDLLADTRVTRDAVHPQRFHAELPASWNILYAFGGVTMATAVNAARAALSQPSFDLLSATATFLHPVSAGPLTMDVRTLRAGKGAEQLTVDLRSASGEHSNLHVVATFGPKRESDTRLVDPTPPDVLSPNETHPPPPPPGFRTLKLPYHQSVEIKSCSGRMPWDMSWEGGEARWNGWFRYKNTPRLASGCLDPVAYIPPSDMIGPALLQRRGPKAPPVMLVSLEISVHFFASTDSEWLLQDTRCFHAGDGYASGMVHLWDEKGRLLAHSVQRAVMRARTF